MARRTLTELTAVIDPWRRDITTDEVQPLANLILAELDKHYGRKVRKSFTTTTPDTTPTVDVNQGDTAVTVASGSFPATYDGQIIQIEGSEVWYEISTTVADTSFVISSGFEGDDITGATVTIAFPRVVLPADFILIDDIARPGYKPLSRLVDETPIQGATNMETQQPTAYYEVEPENTDDYLEIMLVDPPDTVYTYVINGRQRITRYGAAGSKCGLPERKEHILLLGVLWYVISQHKGEEAGSFWYKQYMRAMDSSKDGVPAYAGGPTPAGAKMPIWFRHPDIVEDS